MLLWRVPVGLVVYDFRTRIIKEFSEYATTANFMELDKLN